MDGLNDAGKPERDSVTAKLDFDPAVDSPGKMPDALRSRIRQGSRDPESMPWRPPWSIRSS
jgi:hypothetical protein